MLMNYRDLIGVPVRTKSGNAIGKLADIVVDTETGRLAFLEVRTGGLITGLISENLRISWSNVVSISETEIIVSDATVPEGARRLAIEPSLKT